MFKWHFLERVETNASANQVWKIWSDVSTWPKWDSEVEWVRMDCPFLEGSKGVMKPTSGPKVKFLLTKVIKDSEFVDIAKLPLATIEFGHKYEVRSDKKFIIHEIKIQGLLAPFFGKVIGNNIKLHLKKTMENLSKMAEQL